MTSLEYALHLAALGCWIFPVKPGEKTPAHKGWQQEATRDPEQIRRWFETGDYRVGVFTGRFGDDAALLVVDIDPKPGRNGDAALIGLELLDCELPVTRTHWSPSGGEHRLYRVPVAVKGGVDTLGTGVDIRSRGGLIVAYHGTDVEIATAPAWLVEKCGRADKLKDPVLDRARAFLDTHPPAIEGEGGDLHTYKTAARLKDFGVPELMAWDMLASHWNDGCQPPWDLDELRTKVHNAYNHGVEPPGVADPRREFMVWTGETATGCYAIREAKDIKARLDQQWLIDEVLPLVGLIVLYAAPGRKKSFNAIDMGMAIARSVPWHTKDVEPGAVLYIDADGNIDDRVDAYCLHHALDRAALPFGVISDAPNLFGSEADAEKVIRTIKAWGRRPVRLLVVDTVARVLGGGDENSGQAMGALLANVGKIQRKCQIAVLLVHHLGKDATKGARGHSSLIAAVDTAMEIDKDVITIFKQRDGQDGARFGFRAIAVDLGKNKRKRMVRSLVLEPCPLTNAAAEFTSTKKLPASAKQAWTCFENLSLNEQKVDLDEWEGEFVQVYEAETLEAKKVAFRRARDRLVKQGYVERNDVCAWKITKS